MPKVLVVDDDLGVVKACEAILVANGHTVVCANNRTDGLKSAREDAPDLIIVDDMMELPDDGIVMAQTLKREGCTAPIIMLTSFNQVTGMSYSPDNTIVPVDAFFDKPLKPDVLVDAVNELLSRKGTK